MGCYFWWMFGAWLRPGDNTQCAYTVSAGGSVRVSVSVSVGGRVSVFLFTGDELDSFLGQRHCKAIAASEHDGPEHIVSSRALTPLDIVYLVVQSRSDVRVEVRHARLTSKE